MKFLLTLISLSLPLWGYAQTSYVPATQTLRKRGSQVGITGDVFMKSKTKDVDGKTVDLKDGEKFSRYQGELSGFYGVSDEFQIGLGARYRKNQATQLVNNVSESYSGSGLESTFVNLKYAFKPVNQFQFMAEGTYRYTPYTNETYTAATASKNDGDFVLGDDGSEYSFGLGVSFLSKDNNFVTVRGGYRRPGKELSGEVYYNAEAAMAWKYVALLAGVDGVSSMGSDAYTDDPANKPYVNSYTTNLYNSINREWLTPYVGVNVALGQTWRVELRGAQVLSGRSTDLGTTYSISLVRRVEDKGLQKVDNKFKSYDLEGTVIKISPKKNYVVIDKGVTGDVQKGMKFDLFEFDYFGGNILVASGSVVEAKADTAIVKITQHYNRRKEIKEGLIARAVLATFK